MVLVLLTGVGLLSSSPEYFLRQGWLHAKLALVALLAALTLVAAIRRGSSRRGPVRRGSAPARIDLLEGLFFFGVCAVLLLAVLKPF